MRSEEEMKSGVMSEVKPIAECLNDLLMLDLFVESTLLGLSHASEAKRWLELKEKFGKFRGKSTPNEDRSLELAKFFSPDLESFAKQEMADGHPYLYSISIVRIWTIVETMVNDLILLRLVEGKYRTDSEALLNIKLPLRDILGVSPELQAEAVLNELRQSARTRLQQGVTRFETLLNAVSLSGPIDSDVQRAIFECCQVRNLIVHRNSIVDSKFVAVCPWFQTSRGARVPLTRRLFSLYFSAIYWYAMELNFRVAKVDQALSDPNLFRIQELFLRNVKGFMAENSNLATVDKDGTSPLSEAGM